MVMRLAGGPEGFRRPFLKGFFPEFPYVEQDGMAILYEVNAEFVDPTLAKSWVRWILDEHIGDVIDAGAESGELIRIDGNDEVPRFSIQYRFASRDGLDRYLRDHAARLRDEGTRRFPLDKVRYLRRTGEFVGAA